MRSTKKYDVTVSVNSKGVKNFNLESDLNTGVLTLTSSADLIEKVELMLVMKKKKAARMYCTLEFNLDMQTRVRQNFFHLPTRSMIAGSFK